MKRLFPLLVLLALLLMVPALAVDETGAGEADAGTNTEGVTENDTGEAAPDPSPSPVVYDLADVPSGDEGADGASVSDEVTGRPALPAAIAELFGVYTPKTYTVTTYLSDGTAVESTETVPGVAGMDFDWLAAVGLFALFLYCVMKLIGGLLKL